MTFLLPRLPSFALLVAALLCFPATAQPVLFVDADATGAGDGTSWNDAFADLQDALAAAEAGDEIWVADGTYLPAESGVVDRDASFILVSGTALFGGFDGTEAQLNERDPEANPTVLSGNIGVPGDSTDNAFHVITASGVAEGTLLDGFTITDGYGNGANPNNRGAGIYGVDASLTVRDCRIVENTVVQTDGFGGGGGAFFGASGRVVFERVAFARNGLNGIGGGLWLLGDLERGSEAERRRQLEAEIAGETMAVVETVERGTLSAVLREVEFVENTASFGGAMDADRATVDVVEATFVRNYAFDGGGGLSILSASVDLVNVGLYGNVVDPQDDLSSGGGMTASASRVDLTNTAFVGNTADDFSGALRLGNGTVGTLTNVTLVSNEAEVGGGLRITSGASATVRNAVFWNNSQEVEALSGFATLQHILIRGGCPPDGSGTASCESILDTDPLFVRPPDPGPDGTWGTDDDDYGDLRLQEESPALDFGRSDFLPPDAFDLDSDGDTAELLPVDLAGEPRVVGSEVDLGAYEGGVTVAAEPEPLATGAALAAYPNPARGSVTVSVTLGWSQPVEVALFDVLGRRVALPHAGPLAAGTHALRLATAGLPAGVYVVRVRSVSGSLTRRLVVLR